MTSGPDPFNAFCRNGHVRLAGARAGLLAGLRLVAKDNFDVVGHVTGAGNPVWRDSHPPARATAPALRALLDAGARLVGKTRMDELAYGLTGENAHYGAPVNPRAPLRLPGGSSSGSAVAVAGGLADLALGTDTAGSVRVPASFCGVFGMRPSHGRISTAGVVPLAPPFDTVGWMAADAATLRAAGGVLLGPWAARPVAGVLLLEDAFADTDADVRAALSPAIDAVTAALGPPRDVRLTKDGPGDGPGDGPEDGLAAWAAAFRVLQGRAVNDALGAWVAAHKPGFGPGVAERFAWAATVTDKAVAAAAEVRAAAVARLDAVLAEDCVLCLPSAPCTAPPLHAPAAALDDFRVRTLRLTGIAGLGGLPQVTLPLAEVDGCPVGLSLIGRRGADGPLLDAAVRAAAAVG